MYIYIINLNIYSIMKNAKKFTLVTGDYWECDRTKTWYRFNEKGEMIDGFCGHELRRNNRGVTIATYGLTGARTELTFKPENGTFD